MDDDAREVFLLVLEDLETAIRCDEECAPQALRMALLRAKARVVDVVLPPRGHVRPA